MTARSFLVRCLTRQDRRDDIRWPLISQGGSDQFTIYQRWQPWRMSARVIYVDFAMSTACSVKEVISELLVCC